MDVVTLQAASVANRRDLINQGIFLVTRYGARGNGTTDDTTAILNAVAAAHVKGGQVVFPPGIYLTSAPIVITKTSVSIVGSGAGSVLITPSHAGACIEVYDAEFATEPAGSHNVPIEELRGSTLKGFSIFGHVAGATAVGKIGVYYHDMQNSNFSDIKIVGFSYTGGVGWKMANTMSAQQGTEGTTWDGVEIASCGINLYWTGSGSYNPLNNSFGYTRMYNCRFTVQSGQTMWKMDNGATLYNSDLTWSANLSGSTILMDLNSAGIQSSRFCWQAEGTGVGPQLRHNSEISGIGIIDLQDGPIDCTNTLIYESPNQSHFSVTGYINMPNFTTSGTSGDRTGISHKVVGGPEGSVPGIEFVEHLGGGFYVPFTQGPAIYALNQKHLWIGAFSYAPSGEFGGIVLSPNGPGTEDPTYRPFGTAILDRYGTLALSGGRIKKAVSKVANYTLTVADEIAIFTGTGLTATLPSASNVYPDIEIGPGWGSLGRVFTIINARASTGMLAIASAGGGLPIQLLAPGASHEFVSDGANWLSAGSLPVVHHTPGLLIGNTPPIVYNGAAWTFVFNGSLALGGQEYNATNAQNDGGAWPYMLSAGRYDLQIIGNALASAGIVTVDISYDNGVTWTTLTTQDLYAAGTTPFAFNLSGIIVPTSGLAWLRFRVLSRNAASTGWFMSLSSAEFVRNTP